MSAGGRSGRLTKPPNRSKHPISVESGSPAQARFTARNRGREGMRRVLARALVMLVGAAAMAACSGSSSVSTGGGGQFSGVTVRVVTFTGPQIAEPLQRRAPDFEKLT